MIARRDCETLNIVYSSSSKKFLCYKIIRGGAVVGWAVLLDTQMVDNKYFGNLLVGSIVDCFASPENASGVIRAATEVLEDRGVDLIVSNQAHSAWCLGLRDAGFLQGPSNDPFWASRELTKILHPLQTNMAQYHLTRVGMVTAPFIFSEAAEKWYFLQVNTARNACATDNGGRQ